ncbi:O-antigen ligase [Mycobacterium sp. E740]|uniref:O-antigen ligase family protein n=1 Tax=Mycobacterium sp. E740 TaxID=1834149 RepID=UPI0007FF4250|nr:O-antigen ligase family protein [Mycobacterium sp. E740]OBI74854.1 hypothetical protein A5663_00420 [Mycobacterium sp. E740]
MASALSSLAIAAMSFVALLVFLSAFIKVIRRGEWTGTATLAAVVVIPTISFLQIVVTYLGDWQPVTDAFFDLQWLNPEWARVAWEALNVLLGIFCLTVFVVRVRRPDTMLNIPAVLYLVVALMSFASALLNGDNPFRPVSLVFMAMLLLSTVAPRGLGIHIGVGTCCVIIAIASGLTMISHRDFSVLPCVGGGEKCGILGFRFQGVMLNENALALALALAMPFVYLAFDSWEGFALSGFLLAIILVTGSRSGTMAGLVTFVVLIVVRPNIRRPRPAPIRRALLYLGLAGAAVVGLTLPFVIHNPASFHGRAYLWSLARGAISEPGPLMYGAGVEGWQHFRDAGLIGFTSVYSVHNQWLQVLFSTGLIGFAVFVSMLVVLLWQARQTYALVVGCVLVPVFMLAATERPWTLDTTDWMAWAVVAALLSYPLTRVPATPEPPARGLDRAEAPKVLEH